MIEDFESMRLRGDIEKCTMSSRWCSIKKVRQSHPRPSSIARSYPGI